MQIKPNVVAAGRIEPSEFYWFVLQKNVATSIKNATKTKIDLRVHRLTDHFHFIVNNAFWDCLH